MSTRAKWVLCTLILVHGCQRNTEQQEFIVWHAQAYPLKPLAQSKPFSLTGIRFTSDCPEEAKQGIARCLGRIPIANYPIKTIEVVFAQEPVAARILVEGVPDPSSYIFLSRGLDGEWHVINQLAFIIEYERSHDN